jgi:hypothetical protein
MARRSALLTDVPSQPGSAGETRKTVNRGRLLRALESARLVTRVVVGTQAQLLVEDQEWGDYWLPVKQIGQADHVLDSLESIWSAYVHGNFPRDLLRD